MELEKKSTQIDYKHANYIFLISSIIKIVLVEMFGILIFTIVYYAKYGDEQRLYDFYVSPIITFMAILLPTIFYFLITKKDFKSILRLHPVKLKHVFALIIIGVSVQFIGIFLNLLVIYFLQPFGKVLYSSPTIPKNISELLYLILIIGLIPSICEELFARGILMKGYEKFGVKAAIIISSLLFAIIHYKLTNFIFPFFLGLVLGYVVYRTDSVISGIIVHFVSNLTGILIIYITKPEAIDYYPNITGTDVLQNFLVGLIATVFLTGLMYYIYRSTEMNNKFKEDVKINSKKFKEFIHWPVVICIGILLFNFVFEIKQIVLK